MATSSRKDEHDATDDRDETEDERDEAAADEQSPHAAGAASKRPARAAGDEDEHEDDADAPRGRPAARKASDLGEVKTKKKKRKPAGAAPAAHRAAPQAPALPARQPGALGKSLVLFVIVIGGLALGFALLGREPASSAPAAPKWTVGQTVDAEITLVPSDSKDLACASPDELGGKHCQFEAQTKPWSKSQNDPDEKILKPYTTTDRIQFLAAGVWDQPALKGGKLPNTRFSLKCKYKVEGKLKKPFIRWAQDGQWFERNDDWYAGSVSDCQIVP